MPSWRASFPDIGLDILGTDIVMSLAGDEADVAIRYARRPPEDLICSEVGRDTYILVGSPSLVGPESLSLTTRDLLRFPLIDGLWPEASANPPMWFEWVRVARLTFSDVPDLAKQPL